MSHLFDEIAVVDSHQWFITLAVTAVTVATTVAVNADFPWKRQTILADIQVYNAWKESGDWKTLGLIRETIEDEIRRKYASPSIRSSVLWIVSLVLIDGTMVAIDLAGAHRGAALIVLFGFAVSICLEVRTYRRRAAVAENHLKSMGKWPVELENMLEHLLRSEYLEQKSELLKMSTLEVHERRIDTCRRLSYIMFPTDHEARAMVLEKLIPISQSVYFPNPSEESSQEGEPKT